MWCSIQRAKADGNCICFIHNFAGKGDFSRGLLPLKNFNRGLYHSIQCRWAGYHDENGFRQTADLVPCVQFRHDGCK